jgi:hypothetical protein
VEEYYVDGRRADALVRCEKLAEGVKPITGLDEAGQQAMLVPKVETACRVHALNQQGRRALITLVSHRNQGVGETMRLTLDLGALAPTPDSFVYDHLAGRRLPLAPTLTVDTNASGNLALLEIGEVTPPR